MNSRKWLAIFMMVVMIGMPVGGAAQDATPAPAGGSAPVFFIGLTAEQIPNPIGHLAVNRYSFAPGQEITVVGAEEWVRARLLRIETGSLEVTPIADAPIWRSDQREDGAIEVASAGTVATLATGDMIYLPALDQETAGSLGSYRFFNPGQEETVALSFHLHAAGGGEYTGMPDEIRRDMEGIVGSEPNLQPFADTGGVVALSEITVEPGSVIAPPAGSVLTVYMVESGTVRYEMVKDGKITTEMRWRAGSINSMTPYEGVEQQLVNHTDEPVTLLELTLTPAT